MFQQSQEGADKAHRLKDQKIDELQNAVERLRREAVEAEKRHLEKDDTASLLLKDKYKDKVNSMQIKLNQREADLQKMENLLLEMHRKMDDLKSERLASQAEAKQAVKINAELETELKVVRSDAHQTGAHQQ